MSACIYDRFEPCDQDCKWCKRNGYKEENDNYNKDFLYKYEREEKIIDKRANG